MIAMLEIIIRNQPDGFLKDQLQKYKVGFRKGMMRAAAFAADEIRKEIKSTFKTRTQALGRSFQSELVSDDGTNITTSAFSDLVYSGVQDKGGTIRSSRGADKALAIPISDKAKMKANMWPRSWPAGVLYLFKSKKGNLLLAEKHGAKSILHYVLKKSVTLKAKNYIEATESRVHGKINDIVNEGIEKEMSKGSR